MWIFTKILGVGTIALGVAIVGSSIISAITPKHDHHDVAEIALVEEAIESHIHEVQRSVERHLDNVAEHIEVIVDEADYSYADDTIRKTFDVSEGGVLTIDTDLGAIDVVSGNSDQVEIVIERVAKSSRGKENMEKLEFSFDQDGGSVGVFGKWTGAKQRNWRGRDLKVKITANVPTNYNLDAKTSGGSIAVADLNGNVNINTSGGSLKLGNITGAVKGRTSGGSITLLGGGGSADLVTSGGSITLGEVNGEVSANTSGGSIKIDRARGSVDASTSGGSVIVNEVMGALNASTSGGSIRATITEQPAENCSLTTSGGSVHVKVASDVKFDIDAKTSSGSRLRTDFDILVEGGSLKKNAVRGSVNGGGPTLYLRTSGGGISVNQI